MSKRDFRDFIDAIRRSIDLIVEFTDSYVYSQFENDNKTQFAVIRCFEIIGEATKRIPQELKDKHIDIPWKVMAGMRDRLIHGYDVVDISVLWKTIQKDIRFLK